MVGSHVLLIAIEKTTVENQTGQNISVNKMGREKQVKTFFI